MQPRALLDPDTVGPEFELGEDLPAMSTRRHQRAQLSYTTQGAMRLQTDALSAVLTVAS